VSTRYTTLLAVVVFINTGLFAENENHIIPMLNYDYVSFETQQYHAFGGGLIYIAGNQDPPLSEERNSWVIGGFYKSYIITKERDYPSLYHFTQLIAERRFKKHNFFGVFSGLSSAPVYGGLHTFIAGFGYGYELIRNENYSLILGAVLGIGDFGMINDIALPPVLPAPLVRFNMNLSWISLYFQMIATPSLSITLLPQKRIRFVNNINLNAYRSIDDLTFDCSVWYRFFNESHPLGDIAGLGFGIKRDAIGFTTDNRDKRYDINYYALYGKLDLAFLQLSGGYAFSGIEIYDLTKKENAGRGFFVSVQLAYRF